MKAATLAGAALAASLSSAAHAELVVVVNTANAATRMFSEQAAQFFLGKSPQFTPIDHPKDSPIRAEFYEKVAKKTPAQVEAIWSKIVLTGRGQAPKEVASDAEVKKAIAANVNAIGYIDKASVDGSVKVLLTVQ